MERFSIFCILISLWSLFSWKETASQVVLEGALQVRWIYVPTHQLFSPSILAAGYDNGKLLFLCRALVGGLWSTGKLEFGRETHCTVTNNQGELVSRKPGRFQVLQGPRVGLTWFNITGDGSVPQTAIISGRSAGGSRLPQYVCRGWNEDHTRLIPGKYGKYYKKCFIPIDGQMYAAAEGEILAVNQLGIALGTVQVPDDAPAESKHDSPMDGGPVGDLPFTSTTKKPNKTSKTKKPKPVKNPTSTTVIPSTDESIDLTTPKTMKTKKPGKTPNPTPTTMIPSSDQAPLPSTSKTKKPEKNPKPTTMIPSSDEALLPTTAKTKKPGKNPKPNPTMIPSNDETIVSTTAKTKKPGKNPNPQPATVIPPEGESSETNKPPRGSGRVPTRGKPAIDLDNYF